MALEITRIYEDNPGAGGANFANTELSLFSGDIWIGLSTDASDWNNLVVGTQITLTQGSTVAVITLGARSFLNSNIAIYSYTVDIGSTNFTDGAEITASIGAAVTFTITFSGTNLRPGDTTTATITASDTATNLTEADITLSAGATKGTLTQNGNVFSLPITLPTGVTGLNTLTLTIAANAVDEGNAEATASWNFGTLLNRIVAFNTSDDRFHLFTFSGTEQTSEVVDPGYTTIRAAVATRRRILAFDDVGNMVRVWDLFWNRLPSEDFEPEHPTNAYQGITYNDDDVILVNNQFGIDGAEFYDQMDYSYDASKDIGFGAGGWAAAERGGNNLFFGNNANDTVSIRDLSGVERSTFTAASSLNLQALFATTNRIHLLDRDSGNTQAHDFDGTAQASDNLALGAGNWRAAFTTFVLDPMAPNAPILNLDSVTETSITISITPGYNGGAAIEDWEYELDGDGNWESFGSTATTQTISGLPHSTEHSIKVRGVNSEGNGAASDALVVSTAVPPTTPDAATNLQVVSATPTTLEIGWDPPTNNGGAAIEDNLLTVDGVARLLGSTDTSVELTGLTPSQTVEITIAAVNRIGTGTPSATLEATTDAVFTISTDETDIREGKTFDIAIASTGDVQNLVIGDVSVTGATANGLTENAADDYTLNLTADAGAGDIVVEIAEDVVSPGNAPASATFTRKALPTASFTANPASLRHGRTSGVTIDWDEDVDGITAADVSVDVGSVSNFSVVSARQIAVDVTAPDSGSGDITLRIAANATTIGNAEFTATIAYSPLPTITLTPDSTLIPTGGSTPVTIEISESGLDLTASDVSVDVGRLSDFTVIDASTFSVVVHAPEMGEGSIRLAIREDAVSVGNAETAITLDYFIILMLPVWQTGSALESSVDALESRRINIAGLVSNADKIEVVAGFEEWFEFDGKFLIITEAPIFREDTEFRIYFVATNDDGARRGIYRLIVNGSKLATLHNSLFFKEPLNYQPDRVSMHGTATKIVEMIDNNYHTFSQADDIDVDMADSGGNATRIHYVFIKYKGDLREYEFMPTGGSGSGFTRTIPQTIDTDEGGETDLAVNGFKHDLYPLPAEVRATSVRMQFRGTDVEVYALMLLELGFEIDANTDYQEIRFDKADRVGGSQRLGSGNTGRVRSIGAERWKWEYQLSARLKRAKAKRLYYWMEQNPNFTFAIEFSRHPDRIYPAYWGALDVQGQYFTRVKGNGDLIQFRVSEQ